jgi:hypothetical protein
MCGVKNWRLHAQYRNDAGLSEATTTTALSNENAGGAPSNRQGAEALVASQASRLVGGPIRATSGEAGLLLMV